MSRCWLCGEEAPGGVCLGPHAGYELRGPLGGTSMYVELPGWWPRGGVTASERGWRIRYDPRVEEAARLRAERERAAEARAALERAEELALLQRLAAKHGLVVRPRLGSAAARGGGAQLLSRFGGAFQPPSAPSRDGALAGEGRR